MIKASVTKSVIQLVRKLGYELVPKSRLMPRDIAAHLKGLFAVLNVTCVLDVGANTGQYRDFLRTEVEYQGFIISFEPGRKAVNVLRDNSRGDARWLVYECALGGESGIRAFNIMNSDLLSSFLEPDSSVTDLFASYNTIDHTEDVEVRTLDSVLAELRMQRDIGGGYFSQDGHPGLRSRSAERRGPEPLRHCGRTDGIVLPETLQADAGIHRGSRGAQRERISALRNVPGQSGHLT